MAIIPTNNIQDYFEHIGKSFQLKYFDILEPKYTNGNISYFETVIISLLCRNTHPMSVLEFGTFNGRTTINISVNIPDKAKIITVDLPKSSINNTKFPLSGTREEDENDELGYIGLRNKLIYKQKPEIRNKITQMWIDSADFPVDEYKEHFDFIFVDASHAYENVLNDTKNVLQCIKKGGFILWHDYNGWPGVTKALDEIYKELKCYDQFTQIAGTSMVIYHADNR